MAGNETIKVSSVSVTELLGLEKPTKIGRRNKDLKRINADRERFGGKAVLVDLNRTLDKRLAGLRFLLTDEGPYYAPEMRDLEEHDIGPGFLAVDSAEDTILRQGLVFGGRKLLSIIAEELQAVDALQTAAGVDDIAYRDAHPHLPLNVLNPPRFDPDHVPVNVGPVFPLTDKLL